MTTKEKAEVMLAACEPGAVVQHQHEAWDINTWEDTPKPCWDWSSWRYRIKPSHKLVPLSREDFEGVVTWVRAGEDRFERMVTGLDKTSLEVTGGDITYTGLLKLGWQYSQPSRFAGWKPCSKEESK